MSNAEQVVEKARVYYNSDDADNFYHEIWGGEDIHVGIYEPPELDIFTASRQTVEAMLAKLPQIQPNTRILDLGSGYGGAARQIAQKTKAHVTCLNLSEVQNERNRQKSREANLASLIDVKDGSFESLPFEDESFDVIWSEDAFLHSGEREQVLKEAARVLKKGGDLIFTDPMQSANPSEQIQAVYKRIHLDSMGSFSWYEKTCNDIGLETVSIEDLTKHLIYHYGHVRSNLEKWQKAKSPLVSTEYVETMLDGLKTWIKAGESGDLNWGILHFKKK